MLTALQVLRGLRGGEADRVALVAEAPANAVDPAEAERLVDRLGPGDARPPGRLLVAADQKLEFALVVLLEPGAELRWLCEERGLHEAGCPPP